MKLTRNEKELKKAIKNNKKLQDFLFKNAGFSTSFLRKKDIEGLDMSLKDFKYYINIFNNLSLLDYPTVLIGFLKKTGKKYYQNSVNYHSHCSSWGAYNPEYTLNILQDIIITDNNGKAYDPYIIVIDSFVYGYRSTDKKLSKLHDTECTTIQYKGLTINEYSFKYKNMKKLVEKEVKHKGKTYRFENVSNFKIYKSIKNEGEKK